VVNMIEFKDKIRVLDIIKIVVIKVKGYVRAWDLREGGVKKEKFCFCRMKEKFVSAKILHYFLEFCVNKHNKRI